LARKPETPHQREWPGFYKTGFKDFLVLFEFFVNNDLVMVTHTLQSNAGLFISQTHEKSPGNRIEIGGVSG
jgi:hypothetical protein